MNDIKSKLKILANKQEIHDLSSRIIDNVDTSRVIIAPERKRRIFGLYTTLVSAITACTILLFVGVLSAVKNNSNNESNEMDSDYNFTSEAVQEIYNKEFYNIINVANSFEDISYDTVEFDSESKRMTASEERMLVSDIDNYMYNIEDMFGLTWPVTSENTTIEKTALIPYDKLITVNGPHHSYQIYYSENIISEKNIGKANYKLNSNYVGLLSVGSIDYEISGNKKIENGKIEFNTKIQSDEYNYVVVSEVFGTTQNSFRYDYYSEKSSNGRYMTVEQKLYDDGTTKEIQIKTGSREDTNDLNYENIVLTVSDEYYVNVKIKSRDSDWLYINKNNDGFTYLFKNSKNIY